VIEPVDLTLVQLDPEALLKALVDGGVEFVVIGGIAAILQGDSTTTEDTDTTVRHSQRNFEALAAVLGGLDARMLVAMNDRDVATVDVPITADTFPPLTSGRFLTRYGVLDVVLRPDGVSDFEQWASRATLVTLANGAKVQVASLDDIIASKTAANRPKDQYALARLRALREILAEKEPGAPA
jgi:hypothetical protein